RRSRARRRGGAEPGRGAVVARCPGAPWWRGDRARCPGAATAAVTSVAGQLEQAGELGDELAQCAAAVADGVLLVGGQLRGGAGLLAELRVTAGADAGVLFARDEQRVVAEAAATALLA